MSANAAIGNIRIILAASTSAGTSSAVGLAQDMSAITFTCNGLAGSETAKIQIYDGISQTYVDYKPTGGLVQMTASINSVTITQTWGAFKVVKSSTVASVGVCTSQYNAGGTLNG